MEDLKFIKANKSLVAVDKIVSIRLSVSGTYFVVSTVDGHEHYIDDIGCIDIHDFGRLVRGARPPIGRILGSENSGSPAKA